jgi:hypothetical protein
MLRCGTSAGRRRLSWGIDNGRLETDYNGRMPNDLIAVIKAKQSQIAKLQAELDEARAMLARYLDGIARANRSHRARGHRRRSRAALGFSPTAAAAAEVIRAAGQPLHAAEIAKGMKRKGHAVALGTLVGSLSRWVRSRAVFYRARPNVFGLVELRKQEVSQQRGPSR